jgi:type II secretory pathway predicted ATPase ExeA
MNLKKMNALYGLKWNPFTHDIPTEAIVRTPKFDQFCYRVETLTLEGGFALITGESGLGKSVSLRALSDHLSKIPEITVGEISRPQSGLGDFYREMGSVFGVELRVSNRYGGYKALREKWQHHIDSTLLRPILLIDEAQEMPLAVLSELRLLTMEKFDSVSLLTILLAGDSRLTNSFKDVNLIPLGTRIRTRMMMEPLMKSQLVDLLIESVNRAGNSDLLAPELTETLAEHAAGNPRVMMNLAAECLALGAQNEVTRLDQKLFFQLFPAPTQSRGRRK